MINISFGSYQQTIKKEELDLRILENPGWKGNIVQRVLSKYIDFLLLGSLTVYCIYNTLLLKTRSIKFSKFIQVSSLKPISHNLGWLLGCTWLIMRKSSWCSLTAKQGIGAKIYL